MKQRFVNYKSLVIYHNKFNMVPLLDFTPLEHNLLFSIFKDMKYNDDNVFYWTLDELKDMLSSKNLTNEELVKIVQSLKNKFFNCHFEIILPLSDKYIHMFSYMEFKYEDENKTKIKGLEIEVADYALDIFKELKKNFTSFSIDTFKELRSSYSKNLFRFLSQYRSTGKYKVDYDEIRNLLGVPKDYDYRYFNFKILQPTIKELSNTFKDLKMELIKDRENGKLVYKFLVFTFKPFKNSSSTQLEVLQPSKRNSTTLFALKLASLELNRIANKKAIENKDYSDEQQAIRTLDVTRFKQIDELSKYTSL